MIITYKFRLYPSKKQQKKLFNQFEICKEVYNELLYQNKEYLINKKYGFNSIIKDIKVTCPNYYNKVYSQVLQNISDRINKALNNFFRRLKEKKVKVGFPRYKSKIKSITYPQLGFKLINKKLYTSKIGNIPIKLHRNIKGKVKCLTIKVNNANQWYVCFSCEIDNYKDKLNINRNAIGIDVGLENFVTLSNGQTINNPRFLIKGEKKLKKLQKLLSRKKKGSNRRSKAKLKVARQHIKVTNQRNDFLHKLSRNLTLSYNIIAVEKLNINGMTKNKYLAKHIHDASWSKFIQLLSYKAVTSGGQLIQVNPKNTSKLCSNCNKEMEVTLSKRKFKCSNCNLEVDRDYNAAINIQGRAGLVQTYTPVDDHVRLSFKRAEVYEAGTIRDELLQKQ